MKKERPMEKIGIGFGILILFYFISDQEFVLWLIFFLSIFGVIVLILKKLKDKGLILKNHKK